MTRILVLILGFLLAGSVAALEPFTISDIRVEGLQRISEGTVFSYLPLDTGDVLSSARTRTAIRELYRTGFFDEIAFSREGSILVITVRERAAIASISLSGNKAIKDEDLYRVLADIGLAEGEVYSPQALDRIQQEMVNQYFSQGRYAVQVDARVTELDRNRVRIAIVVDEGKTAKIRHINIVGNTLFTDKEIRDEFESDIPPRWKFWSKDNQYSREKLSGDLEKIRSYYQDRGYIDAAVESTQVSISPDKQDIYITANVTEGERFNVREVQVTGDLVVPEATLRRLILMQPSQVFSRKQMEQSVENITALLSNVGYAFANVNPIPQIDRDNLTVDINFYVDPGKRVYIRRVQFTGNSGTKDEVMRREMRQFEGAWFSQAAIDRSKDRLQRLTYFESVEVETPAVPATDDQVDVIVTVQERPAGSFSVGLGYSEIQGLIYSLSVQQDNFLGSGKRVGAAVSSSSIIKSINLSYENPYWTDDGVSRGFYLRYQEFDQGAANISSFTSSEVAGGVSFGAPLTEIDFVRGSLGIRSTDINIGQFICIDLSPDGFCNEFVLVPSANDPLSASLDFNGDGILSKQEREFDTYDISMSWTRDSRNHFLNPTRGSRQLVQVEASIPGSTREYYKLNYRASKYIPIWRDLTLSFHGSLGYGDAYDDYDAKSQATPVDPGKQPGSRYDCLDEEIITLDTGLPFFEHFYGGGVRDIRGFDDNTLGPKDPFCRAVGGDLKVSGGIEVAIPTPFAQGSSSRIALFVDIGNVYENLDAFDASLLRASAGLSVTWQAPIGPIIMNFAVPIKEEEGDRTESIQFSFGTTF
ncbi:MAG: outer membrane protein assembly factor BamA [Xanthomonadales bacterium]|nr:outer membrane protein assembly factor BamA [Xanthomonadales bacterium]NIN59297.1 outer membrane protein assembly factor BamA [Xanthomonadales bacterium]NIN74659.1 outer membrane protein assembly factor BamA [Xanthomonadales bacterium]NIO13325.1 outer membrane protein assembly factor BamA [Xanthomonadales bacterium]NIP11690.1 outer membrane protein assembly factor BamA [Xanthomonadales bacterium]